MEKFEEENIRLKGELKELQPLVVELMDLLGEAKNCLLESGSKPDRPIIEVIQALLDLKLPGRE